MTPMPLVPPVGGLTAATWNIAAINTNPFEYWISHEDDRYNKLMSEFEAFIDEPGEKDVPISAVFTDAYFSDLEKLMLDEGWSGVELVRKAWNEDYSKRKIVTGFMLDKAIGAKRLASMPDRITNTISVQDSKTPAYRPTVVNQYTGSLGSVAEWWPKWQEFMFKTSFKMDTKGGIKSQKPCQMLGKILRSKYPAITEEEEAISLPLQVLCQAIIDAVLVHIMTVLSPDGFWQTIKLSIIDAIFSKKEVNTMKILSGACDRIDIICLQEAALSFKEVLTSSVGSNYHVLAASDADPKRDQNSLLLLRKANFPGGIKADVTAEVLKELGKGAPIAAGDLVAVTAADHLERLFLIASFHGDTNGLATKPVMTAVDTVLKRQAPGCKLVFGMDANVYLKKKEGWQDVDDFLSHASSLGLRSCWPTGEDLSRCCTTCHARTFLQPQLNKGVRSKDKLVLGDISPKDHILVQQDTMDVLECHKDNTGMRLYLEQECFPSLYFPSDHAIVSAVFQPRDAKL